MNREENIKILIVEDNADQAETLKVLLDLHCAGQFDITIESTLTSSIERLKNSEDKIDCILLDVRLPDSRDGFNTFEKIHNQFPDIPIIIVSCLVEDEHGKFLELGAVDIFDKDRINTWQLVKTIEHIKVKKDETNHIEFMKKELNEVNIKYDTLKLQLLAIEQKFDVLLEALRHKKIVNGS